MTTIATMEQLEALYGRPGETSLVKEVDRIIPEYAAFIEASPFVTLATAGPDGLDCSPRGDRPGFVRIADERTLMMPDRHGNNRAVAVDAVYFQCARAIHRSELWNAARHVDPKILPTPGRILAAVSRDRIDGAAYDAEWPERARKTMW